MVKLNPHVLVLNVQCLNCRKLLCVESIIDDLPNLKFICLSETWMNQESINSFHIRGFALSSSFCRKIFKGGGVAIWSREDVAVSSLDLSDYNDEKNIEICGLKFNTSCGGIYLFVCYRSPSGDVEKFTSSLERVLHDFFSTTYTIILAGDFNFNFASNSRQVQLLRDVLFSFNLQEYIYIPTRVQSTSATVIDNIFSNPTSIGSVCVMDNTISDHRALFASLPVLMSLGNTSEYVYYKRDYNEPNVTKFARMLDNISWDDLYKLDCIDYAFNYFFAAFMDCFHACFPLNMYKTRRGKSWVTSEVKRSSANVRDLYMLQREYPILKDFYLQHKNKHIQLLEKTKHDHYTNKINGSSNQIKTGWDVINELSGNFRERENIVLSNNDKLVDEPSKVAEIFNRHFIESVDNIISRIPNNNHVCTNNISATSSMCVMPYHEFEVKNLFRKIKNKTSAGPDEVPCSLIKNVSESLIKPITFLINLSFHLGKFPASLKSASVIPLHKKGSKLDVTNYRPLSISSSFSKLFEYAMLDRLISYIDKHSILANQQHGYRVNRSTITAIHAFFDRVIEDLDSNKFSVGIFCDLSRAFDCVDHDSLLTKLQGYGIRGVAVRWFESYLSNRVQFVKINYKNKSNNSINSVRSSSLPVLRGVPQGSVLGPVLFLLYVDDITRYLSNYNLFMYADDTSALISGCNVAEVETQSNILLKNMNIWFNNNELYLNNYKTKFLVFHSAQNKKPFALNINSNNQEIDRVSEITFLGITMDETLSWNTHCQKMVNKLNSICYQIRNLRHFIDFGSLLSFYFANVQSRLSYGITVWGSSAASRNVFLAQKRIIRCMGTLSPRQSCKSLFKEWNILTMPSIYIYELLIYIYKNKQDFPCNHDIHSYQTRNNNKFYIPRFSLNLGKNCPRSLGLKLYNALPQQFKDLQNEKMFGSGIRAFLRQHCFYSVDEYFDMCKN